MIKIDFYHIFSFLSYFRNMIKKTSAPPKKMRKKNTSPAGPLGELVEPLFTERLFIFFYVFDSSLSFFSCLCTSTYFPFSFFFLLLFIFTFFFFLFFILSLSVSFFIFPFFFFFSFLFFLFLFFFFLFRFLLFLIAKKTYHGGFGRAWFFKKWGWGGGALWDCSDWCLLCMPLWILTIWTIRFTVTHINYKCWLKRCATEVRSLTTVGITHVRTLKSGKKGQSPSVEPISLSEVITASSFSARIKNMGKKGILYLYEAIGMKLLLMPDT